MKADTKSKRVRLVALMAGGVIAPGGTGVLASTADGSPKDSASSGASTSVDAAKAEHPAGVHAAYKCGLDKVHQTYRNCTGHNEHLTVAYFEALTKEHKIKGVCKKPGTASSWKIVGPSAAMYAAHAQGRCSPGQV